MAGRASRKTVTVLFCDLAGSTALGERLDPEPLRTLLTGWYEAMRSPVERHDGTVEKFIGDAVMAVFGVPRTHEDDALRAVRAAVEMRDAAASLEAGLLVRVGVTTGEVVTGDDATTLVTGDAVNTAKRLQEAAEAGEILIGEDTQRLVAHAMRLEPVEPVRAKGKQQPVTAWRVLAAIAGAEPFVRRLDAPIVGRKRELGLLRHELERVERGLACRLVTILGPAGIGKSRLAAELLAEARTSATVIGARCLAHGDGLSFLPVRDMVASAGGERVLERVLVAEADGDLVLERLGGALAASATPVSSEEAFWAVRRLFEALARDRPLVVYLEDVHWAAPTFLDLVEYVAGWSHDTPILLLCAARPELLEERPHWRGATVALEPLGRDDSRTLLAHLTAEWPVPARTAAAIEAVAEGNPLFIEQLVAALAEGGDAGTAPPTIQALLAARLDRLAPIERAVLERAAVAGREFWRGAVAQLSPPGEREELGRTLLELVRKELLQPGRSQAVRGDDCFQFRHGLIRDAAYAAIPKEVRAHLHLGVAEWLERRDGEDELVAYHLEQAHLYGLELGLPETEAAGARAGRLLAAAGRRAFGRNDAQAAETLLERALALLPEEEPGRLELLRQAGLAHWWSGDADRARDTLGRQIELARHCGDVVEEWSGLLDLTSMELVAGAVDATELLRVAEQAIAAFEPHDDAALARAWRRVAHAHCASGRYGPAAQAGERALEHAHAAGSRFEEARIVDVYCTSLLYGPVHVDEGISRCERMLREAGGRPVQEANVAASLAGLLAMRGDFEAARRLIRFAEERFEELGLRLALAGTTQIAGPAELLAGDPVAAERELRRGLEILLPGSSDGYQESLLAEALRRQGRRDEAALLVGGVAAQAGAGDATARVAWLLVDAKLRAERSPAEGVELARQAVAAAESTDATSLLADALVDLAALLGRAGEERAAADAVRRALDLYEQKGNAAAAARVAGSAQAV